MDFKNIKGGCAVEDIITVEDIEITESASAVLSEVDIFLGIFMHVNHDWGIVSEEQWASNEDACKNGGCIFSRFKSSEGVLYRVVTELGHRNKMKISLED